MPALPYSPWLLAALVIAALAIAVVLLWKRSAPAASNSKPRNYRLEDWNPRTMRPLTHAELRMMLHLRKALPECLLLPQIALARFMNVNQNKSYNQWFGSVGRRCVDFLVCSEQGDVLGVIQLNNPKSKKSSATSEGTQRKLHTLEAAQIPVWQIAYDPLPDAANLREMVLPELEAAHEHSVQHAASPESVWQATQFEPRRPASAFEPSPATAAKTAPVREAEPAKADRWESSLAERGGSLKRISR
ncbi:MAG: DUF2726 domain-containing protein [Brachymonas sp.]|nr:DUF2726 domain-containing protein [Brachymonas sp.]